MRCAFRNTALALGLSGATAFATTGSLSAAPVPSGTIAVKAAAPDHTTGVYWPGDWGWDPGLEPPDVAARVVGAGFAYGRYYPYPGYAYPLPAYAYPAYYAPAPLSAAGPYVAVSYSTRPHLGPRHSARPYYGDRRYGSRRRR